jgi:hypothetical protein
MATGGVVKTKSTKWLEYNLTMTRFDDKRLSAEAKEIDKNGVFIITHV